MANLFPAGSPWDPYQYANTVIAELRKKLGLASAVFRGFDKTPSSKGSTIKIPKPQSFTAQDMPISTADDLKPGTEDLVVDQHKGVLIGMTDKELTFSREEVINMHISPAAYAIADAIDQSLAAKIKHVPWYHQAESTAAVKDITQVGKVLNDNNVPDGMRFLALNNERVAGYQELAVFHQANTSADGDQTQRTGELGEKFGFRIFNNRNIPDYTAGALSPGTQAQLNAAASKGDTQIVVKDSGGVLTGTAKEGDTLVIAGHTQRYAVTADASAGSNLITLNIYPGLAQDYAENANITFRQVSKALNLAAHRDAIALGMAPLDTTAARLGLAVMVTVTDPVTGLAIRLTYWYDGKESKLYARVDALWGVKILDANKAARLES